MPNRFCSYNNITTFSEFSIEDLKYVYEQLVSKMYGIPYTLYEKWEKDLNKVRNYILDKKFPYIDFLLSQFVRYKTLDNDQFRIPYLSAINNNPLKEQIYNEWLLKDRLYVTDFSLYFFDTSLLEGSIKDVSLLKKVKKGLSKESLLQQAKNNNLHISSYAYYFKTLKPIINKINVALIVEIASYIRKNSLYSRMKSIYGEELN